MHHTVAGKQSKHALETNGYLECSQLFREGFDFNETGPILLGPDKKTFYSVLKA
jgi:hypothetical protein